MRFTQAKTKENIDKVHSLYLRAFPECERKSFEAIVKKADEGKIDILCIENDNGEFIGLAICILYDKYALLDYFAIEDDVRGRGYGKEALLNLKDRYSERVFFLEIESTFDECDNLKERLKRKDFYLSCSMVCMPYIVNFLGTLMEVLTFGDVITYEEHKSIYQNTFDGEISKRISFGRYL